MIPELFGSSLEQQLKMKGITINGSNGFDGFKMNGFQFVADTEDIEIKHNNNLLTGKNNKLLFDGVFQKSKKNVGIGNQQQFRCYRRKIQKE